MARLFLPGASIFFHTYSPGLLITNEVSLTILVDRCNLAFWSALFALKPKDATDNGAKEELA